eukprot:691389-Prorocentrum_minimum.AAC.4
MHIPADGCRVDLRREREGLAPREPHDPPAMAHPAVCGQPHPRQPHEAVVAEVVLQDQRLLGNNKQINN